LCSPGPRRIAGRRPGIRKPEKRGGCRSPPSGPFRKKRVQENAPAYSQTECRQRLIPEVSRKTKIRTTISSSAAGQIRPDGVVYKADHITAQMNHGDFSAYVGRIRWRISTSFGQEGQCPDGSARYRRSVAILVVCCTSHIRNGSTSSPSYSYSDYAGYLFCACLVSMMAPVCLRREPTEAPSARSPKTNGRVSTLAETDGQYRLGSNKKGDPVHDELKLSRRPFPRSASCPIHRRLHTIREPLPRPGS